MAGIGKVRILVLGDSGVGKTSLVHLMCQNEPTTNPSWTIGCSVDVKLHEYKAGTASEKTYFVELWDIGGCTGHQNSRGIFYNPVNGIILVHDLTNRKSQHNLRSWLAEVLRKDCKSQGNGYDYDPEEFAGNQIPLLVIGTKADQAENMRDKGKSRNSSVAEEFGADQFDLDCQNVKYLAPGSTNSVKLSRFFDKVIERRYYSREKKVDKKLTKLEDLGDQVSQQSERIKELEKCIKIISGDNYVGSNKTEVVQDRQCKSENFINQMRADIENIEYNKSKLKGTRSKVQKAASFQEKCTQRSLKVRRSVHTVPSDKDEERRMKSFRRECLSKAIKWNIVDLVKAISDWQIVQFPKWLDKSEIRSIERGSDQRNCFRRFLYVLIEKDFDTMQEWLSDCSLDETVIQKVWRTYEEFSDIETNKIRMKCFHCRLVETVNVLDVVDHLFSAEIISCKLCLQISSSGLIVGAQEGLWKDIFEECRQFNYPKALVSAVKIAVTDKFTVATGNEKDVHESLINLMDDVDASDILDCNCQERCAKSFHPLSCLKSISLAGVYFSPPTKRKNDSSSESGSPNSSSSSTNSIDEELKDDRDKLTDNLSSVSREAAVKKPDLPPRVPKKNKKQSRTSRKVPDSVQKMLQREAKQIDIAHNAESSSDSVEWDCKPPAVPARNSFNKVTHMSSHRQENNPNTIRAVNVIINSGLKYNFIKSGNHERSSSSSSEQ